MKVRCIVKDENERQILLCYYKEGGHYFLPGGSIEFQETAEEAIYREFKEEIGLDKSAIKVKEFRGIIENMYANKHEVDLLFNVSFATNEINSQEEQVGFFWKSLSEIDNLDVRPAVVKDIVKSNVGSHFLSIDREE